MKKGYNMKNSLLKMSRRLRTASAAQSDLPVPGYGQPAVAGIMPAALLLIGVLMTAAIAYAGERQYLKKNDLFCVDSGSLCIRGSLYYDVNPRLLSLRGRVQKAKGPGLLRFRLSGRNDLGHPRYTTLEIRLRGRYREIINSRMIPDAADVRSWMLESTEYLPKEPD
ncbi:MAG: hypothetical protein OEW68_15090 [Gammaproteobacteria bacterium]|nr:hypothetical protein [Gammaproteobacteria bacterium]MDH4316152.1 hypothetical protein [Gammaproteobacteria bacterium]MDH5215350.1 hypothetical protein [Gammaproteobacteria bacterium]